MPNWNTSDAERGPLSARDLGGHDPQSGRDLQSAGSSKSASTIVSYHPPVGNRRRTTTRAVSEYPDEDDEGADDRSRSLSSSSHLVSDCVTVDISCAMTEGTADVHDIADMYAEATAREQSERQHLRLPPSEVANARVVENLVRDMEARGFIDCIQAFTDYPEPPEPKRKLAVVAVPSVFERLDTRRSKTGAAGPDEPIPNVSVTAPSTNNSVCALPPIHQRLPSASASPRGSPAGLSPRSGGRAQSKSPRPPAYSPQAPKHQPWYGAGGVYSPPRTPIGAMSLSERLGLNNIDHEKLLYGNPKR